MPGQVRSRVLLSGRVQGVGFRYHTMMKARELGAAGWVRNLSDGRVEVHIDAAARARDELCAWLRHGPPGARVDQCAVLEEAEPTAPLSEFEIRPSR